MQESLFDLDTLGFERYRSEANLGAIATDDLARVIAEHRTLYTILGEGGERSATVRGSFHEEETYPKVGDWVRYEPGAKGQAVIEEILPRVRLLARRDADGEGVQVMVSNVDLVGIVQGLDNDFNVRRLERYLLLVQESGAHAVVILTKADVAEDHQSMKAQVEKLMPSVPVLITSSKTGEGLKEVAALFTTGSTGVFLGSSGAGKSTLTNALLGKDHQKTGEVRGDDDRGRHTTTHRELFLIPGGGIIIDTPGMRELGNVSHAQESHDAVFSHVLELESLCQYTDCDHEKSAGCRVQAALTDGTLDDGHYRTYLKLLSEKKFGDTRGDGVIKFEQRRAERKRKKAYQKAKEANRADAGSV